MMGAVTPFPAPSGRTALRLEWPHLPPAVRAEVERRLGAPVVEARSQNGGYTPGLASVLVGADGRRVFVKAASLKGQRAFAASYAEEARKLAALPAGVPAPRLLWTFERESWLVLGIEHVAARTPARPWHHDELVACLDLLHEVATLLTPAPPELGLVDITRELADWPASWDYLLQTFVLPGGEEAAALAAGFADHLGGGSTVVHMDVRDDNLLLCDDGRVLVCDWNWPVVGPAWLDALSLLVGARGDGLDVEPLLAEHPALAGATPDGVDAALALLTGYFLRHGDDPVPPASPYLREVQQWQGDVCWEWLRERRGWS
jgi:aminoglycoside phosphotransferase (APT) family kinase protein